MVCFVTAINISIFKFLSILNIQLHSRNSRERNFPKFQYLIWLCLTRVYGFLRLCTKPQIQFYSSKELVSESPRTGNLLKKPRTYLVCTRKRMLRAPSLAIFVICAIFVHTREWDHGTQVGVEPLHYILQVYLVKILKIYYIGKIILKGLFYPSLSTGFPGSQKL